MARFRFDALEMGRVGCSLKEQNYAYRRWCDWCTYLDVLNAIQMSTASSQKEGHGGFAMIIISLIVALGVAL
jgi:hypothetical protein